MKTANEAGDVDAENRALRETLEARGLAVEDVMEPAPDAVSERRRLEEITLWVLAWERFGGNRQAMSAAGYRYPPVEPDFDPDGDWLLFERWVRGRPVRWNYTRIFGPMPDPAALHAAGLAAELERVRRRLDARGVCLELAPRLPPAETYKWLRQNLPGMHFEYLAAGTRLHLDGCGGDCRDCFQRPWCETASDESADNATS